MSTKFDLDLGSPRPETPEPSSIQGRRNVSTDIQLLNDEGAISDQVSLQLLSLSQSQSITALTLFCVSCNKLEACLQHIFTKYCTPQTRPAQLPSGTDGSGRAVLLTPPPNAYLSPEGLDAWARDTNGAPFTQETKDQMVEFLDVTDQGELTCVYV
jgi:hypothetical protein